MRIYLADLGHNQLTLSSDVYPLGIANLSTWLRARLRAGSPPEVSIYREPEDLKRAFDQAPPDVLGLSNYAWNHELSRTFARYAKKRHPATLTAMGGPHYPLTVDEQDGFVRENTEIDVFVNGPTYEGEQAFCNLIQRLVDGGCSLEALGSDPVDGNTWLERKSGRIIRGGEVPRIRDLDEIPSPYRDGTLDAFFATGYFPLMQIARGCPFSCTFCNSGVESNNRVYAHSIEDVKADLVYIAERVRPEVNLCLADDNFGMYARDEEIADFMGWLQKKYGWPKYIRTTTGKNNSERIIRVMRKVKGALPMTAAVQSMNPEVLSNIKRSNVKLETYARIQQELQEQGMQSYGELILCLPGETRATFLKAVSDLMDAGAKRISAHQLMLLHGAELSNPEVRARFGFETRFRLVARNIGDYGLGEPVAEVEEMVVATPQFSFDDYLSTRVFHLLLTIFYYEGNFDEAFALGRQAGVKPFDLVMRMQAMLGRAPATFRAVIDDFLRESQEELFTTREACLEWTRRNFAGLVSGALGGNLLSKYSMIGRFYTTAGSVQFLRDVIKEAVEGADGAVSQRERDAVFDYLDVVLLHAPFRESLAQTPTWLASFDVETWLAEGATRPLAAYEFPQPRRFVAQVEPERRDMIQTRVTTFGEHPSGLGKFTRTLFARDLRRTLVQTREPVGATSPDGS
jgi:radical SAM superfamily enzyme YgiQ (UPF0313 family)